MINTTSSLNYFSARHMPYSPPERDIIASRASSTSDGGVWLRADRPRSSTGGVQGYSVEEHDRPGDQTGIFFLIVEGVFTFLSAKLIKFNIISW